MKPTPLHKALIQDLIHHLKYWEVSNDISSPSHNGLIEEEIDHFFSENGIDESKLETKLLKNEIKNTVVKLWSDVLKVGQLETKK